MSFERQIPGGCYVNETSDNQAQIPGYSYIDEEVTSPIPPAPPVSFVSTGGGGGLSGWGGRKNVEKWVDEVYQELTDKNMPEKVVKEAEKIVAPYSKVGQTPKARVDWERLKLESKRVSMLIDLWEAHAAEMTLQEDEEEAFMAGII